MAPTSLIAAMAALTSTALAMPSFYEAPAANITFKSTFVGVCNRTALLETADAYIAAQAAGSLAGLTPLFAPGFFYVENNKELAITASPVLKKKLHSVDRYPSPDRGEVPI